MEARGEGAKDVADPFNVIEGGGSRKRRAIQTNTVN